MDKLEWFRKSVILLKGINEISSINLDTTLRDLELDSLDIVELQMMYEDEIGYEISSEPSYPINTVGDLLSIMT